MWQPTHLVVTVLKAKGLLIKGKSGTNNCFVTIALGKEKFQTTVKEKASNDVDWHEECELTIPSQGNKAELILTVLHRNKLGLDEFLGQTILPLCDLDVYESPKSKWFRLEGKQGKENKKERGELEVRISFTVKAGSLMDLSKVGKNKSSSSLANIGGSLLSLSTLDKRKKIKDFTKSLGSKNIFKRNSKNRSSTENMSPGLSSRSPSLHSYSNERSENIHDPGVISENEDEFIFETLSQKGSSNSLSFSKENALNKQNKTLPNHPTKTIDEWQQKLTGKRSDSVKTVDTGNQSPNKELKESFKSKLDHENKSMHSEDFEDVMVQQGQDKMVKKSSPLSIQLSKIGFSNNKNKLNESRNEKQQYTRENVNSIQKSKVVSDVVIKKYEGLSRDELMLHAYNLENDLSSHKQKIKELEDYLDLLLLRVMEREPRILQNPYARVNPTKSG